MDDDIFAFERNQKMVRQDIKDRYLALVQVVDLDIALTKLVKYALVNDEKKVNELFEDEKHLQTFSSKVMIAYCLGLISKDEYHDLNVIRKIRNYFAHKSRGLTFEEERIANLCYSLKLPKKVNLGNLAHRDKFLAAYVLLDRCLNERFRSAHKRGLEVPTELDLSNMAETVQRWLK